MSSGEQPGRTRVSPAQLRSARLLAAARWWARREIRHTLDGLWVAGLEEARATAVRQPVIFAATHVAFWDLFLLLALDEALGTDGFGVMDAENLCRVPFFARLGIIAMQRDRPRAGLRAAAALLGEPGRAVWFFPQGRTRPAHLRPLGFRRGICLLARLAPRAEVVPVALQYAYAERHGPVAYAAFGAPIPTSVVARDEGLARLESAVVAELGRIDRYLAGAEEAFHPLVRRHEPALRPFALLQPRSGRVQRT